MIRVYDVESYPNFFSISFMDVNTKEKSRYYIWEDHNDLDKIIELFSSNKEDWFVGFNSFHYDDRMIAFILNNQKFLKDIDADLITLELYSTSQKIIETEDIRDNKYHKLFNRFDLKTVGNINKSLKLVGIDLRHPKIQDLPYPFEHKVQKDEVNVILLYNDNDVEITYLLYQYLLKKIKLRQELSNKYNLNLMNESDSSIANRILEKDYQELTGIPYSEFKNSGTDRIIVDLKDCIPDNISFNTKPLQNLLDNIKSKSITKEDKFEFNIFYGDTRYDILKGGIHSNMPPNIYESNDEYIIIDADAESYYPNNMINNRTKPKHLSDKFLDLLESYTETRILAKRNGDKVAADGLKLVINSIYGKLGSSFHWLRDILAMYSVTIPGQLNLLMLVEDLETNGIAVFYAK